MSWDFSSMIIKAADNINRGVENSTKAGDGNNGQTYQIEKSEGGSSAPSSGGVESIQVDNNPDNSGVESFNEKIQSLTNIGKDALGNLANQQGESETETEAETTSDERLKKIFNKEPDALKCFAKIDSIMFEYNNKAKKIHPDGENHVDDDVHYGVKAQDLAENPFTESVVSTDEKGFEQVDATELTMANTSVIAEMCRRLLIIEKVLGLEVK